MLIQIKNLRLRTIIGINEWERDKEQDIVINASIEFDGAKAGGSDDLNDSIDYKALTKSLIEAAQSSKFFLLEKLGARLTEIVMEDPRVTKVSIEIDKPNALRFADSVSLTVEAFRD